ncbi:rhodanese-like domain-containing protein [Marixanthomonas spongiae]|uniref:Rhodanese-like domain-containing protein n=1 Tax=Marixanthomonas spongiae TaxID=2174845 RepID=A0A2U0I549_9FLAO|nr:rhodanese-like domain-containing protein [Marixanthomonas spongiae]PVW16233.1 rhodanese-like domain-containing protein [Marixanthomonas spongiae]
MKNYVLHIFLGLSVLFASCQENKSGTVEVMNPHHFLETMENDSSSQLVDVRTTEEFEVSHLKDAQNICVTDADFEERIKELDKNKPVYVYCRSGNRSARAAKILEENGFTKVYDLQGGITSWDEEGLETEQ